MFNMFMFTVVVVVVNWHCYLLADGRKPQYSEKTADDV